MYQHATYESGSQSQHCRLNGKLKQQAGFGHTPPMLKFARMPTWLVWTLCIAILATRVNGVHLHLCFDGQQPQVSVQSGHAGSDEAGVTHTENDTDVSLVGDALLKNLSSNGAVPVLLVAAILLFILGSLRQVGFTGCFSRPAILHAPGFHLRPPLRGPPR